MASRAFEIVDEEIEELSATLLASIRPTYTINRLLSPNFCRARAGSTSAGMTEPTPTTIPGTSSLRETAWIAARSSAELT